MKPTVSRIPFPDGSLLVLVDNPPDWRAAIGTETTTVGAPGSTFMSKKGASKKPLKDLTDKEAVDLAWLAVQEKNEFEKDLFQNLGKRSNNPKASKASKKRIRKRRKR